MNWIRWGFRVAFTTAVTIALAAPAVAQNYTITDLGVLSTINLGALTNTADTDSNALAINASGSVVGVSGVYDTSYANLGFYVEHAFLWTPGSPNGTTGTMTYLSGLPGDYCYSPAHTVDGFTTPAGFALFPTIAFAINSTGQVVGTSYWSPDGTCPKLEIHGVLWQNGLPPQDLGVPPWQTSTNGFYIIQPTSINDKGQIVGYTQPGQPSNSAGADAWLFDGSFHDLGFLPVPCSNGALCLNFAVPSGINSGGTMVGTAWSGGSTIITSVASDPLGFAHTGAGPIQATDALGTLGGPDSSATGINEAGIIVGASTTAGGAVHAFSLYPSGAMFDLGTASKDPLSNSNALAINRANDIVGWSNVDPSQTWMSSQHAVMWQDGGNLIDLNSLLLQNADPPVAPPVGTTPPAQCQSCWELISASGINDLGQIVGEGLYRGQRHAFLLTPNCVDAGGDTDGDGLCDDWEKNGVTVNGVFVDLHAMGADPMHKDIFVQADYMVAGGGPCGHTFCSSPGHTHFPDPDAIADVTQAFAGAPVGNPDKTTGITLHVDCGPDCIMNPLTGDPWGSLSQAHAIPEIPILGGPVLVDNCVFLEICQYDWTAFAALQGMNFSISRVPIFHYMIFAHELGMYDAGANLLHISGVSQAIPHSNFVVSLGSFKDQVGSTLDQAGTFMHELGHNLGLHHGGYDDTNYKPNYLSVMNYLFQTAGLTRNTIPGLLDYSEFRAIPNLNEGALNETVGLNGGAVVGLNGVALTDYGTSYYCPGSNPDLNPMTSVPKANGQIDWDCDGNPFEASIPPTDINGNGIIDGIIPNPPLSSSADWNHLIYNGGAIGASGVGAPPSTYQNADPETRVPVNSQTPFRVQVGGPGLNQVLPGTSLNQTFTINNTGLQADTYNLSPVSALNWWTTTGIPSTLTLAGGASQQIAVPVTVSGCITPGTQGQFTIKAVSQTSPSIADNARAVLIVLPNPAGSVAVPNVVGQTQANAQAAIVSAGLVVGTVTTQSSTTVPAGTVISQSPIACGVAPSSTSVSLTVSSGVAIITVPNVVGETQVAAVASLTAAGLTFGGESTVGSPTIPAGDVVSQNPPAGSEVTPGTFYFLYIASATPAADLTPNVVGDAISTAVSVLNAGGLNLGVISNAFSLTIPAGTVMSQVPAAGSPTSLGSYVNVTVSFGNYAEIDTIPNIVGDTQANAIYAILTAGFSVGSIGEAASNTVPAGLVILQSPLAGGGPPPDTPVSFSISTGLVGPQSFVVPNVYGLTQSAASSAITAAGLTVGTITLSQKLSVPVGNVFSQTPQPGAYAPGGSAVTLSVSAAAAQYTVPDLVTNRAYFTTAYADIIDAGLTPGTFTAQISSTVPSDYVISESPAAGTVVAGGAVVNVTYSVSIPQSQYTIPSVVGENQVLATGSIGEGFFVSVTREPSTTVPDSFVISQTPAGNSQSTINTTINLVVSSGGPVTAAVPNVVGTSITDGVSATGAEPTLNAAGFAVGSVTYQPSNSVPAGQVTSQNPPAGSMAAWDTSVSLVCSSGPPVSITVPNIVGKTLAAAVSALYATSSLSQAFPPWTTWTLTTQSSPTVPAGVVISQNPSAGTVLQGARPGTGGEYAVPVTFVVSAGPNPVPAYSLLTQFGDYGGPYSGDGQFFVTGSLAIDPNTGNILAGDSTGRIQIFDRNGNFKGYFGGTGAGFFTWTPIGVQAATFYPAGTGGGLFGSGFLGWPYDTSIVGFAVGLAVDPINGNVVALDAADRVLIFNSAGAFQGTFGSPGQGPGQFEFQNVNEIPFPGGVAIDPVTENILVTDWGNNRVQIFSSTGAYLGQFGTQGAGDGQFGYGPVGIAIDPETRNIVVMDNGRGSGTARVQIFNSSGAYLSQIVAPAAANANWTGCACEGLAIDAASHNIIVQGAIGGGGSSIQIFDSKGNYLSQFGGFGITVGGGLAVDPVSHHIVTFGLAGNEGGTVQIFGAPGPLTPTSTALTSSLNPANFGQSVTFMATVTGADDITGTVQFFYGGTSLGSPVTLAAGMASLMTSTLPVGTDSITAVYSGDTYNAASNSPVLNETITGSASASTIALATSVNPVMVGHPVKFTATVTGNSPTGTIKFMDGTTSLGAPLTLTAGSAGLTTSSLAAGTHSITAVYSGDGSNTPSTSAVLSEVISLKTMTTTAVATSAVQATPGQLVTFTASVTGSSPTGTIQFMDGAGILGAPVTLTAGVATFPTAALSAGTHVIEAVYSGDSSNFASTSSPLSEVISSATTTITTVVSSLNPSVAGQSVTFTATVTGRTPTGTIQFLDSFVDGALSLGSPVALTGNTATLTLSTLSAGTHPITAIYEGDSYNFASTSTALNEVVSPATTTTTLASSLNPATAGEYVTLTATVTGYSPTGTILFFDGATQLGAPVELGESVTLLSPAFWFEPSLIAAGEAALTSSIFAAGTHMFTAVYSGDNSNSASTSMVLNEQVLPASTVPGVTPPASISIPATEAGGATSNASPALAAFLAGGSAIGGSGSPLVALAPQIGGVSVTSATLFPVGTTTVTFRFQDPSGDIGTATSTVTVAIGTPRITGSVAGVGTDPSGAIYVNVVLTNTGTGNARNLKINSLVFRTLSGTGTVTYDLTLSPSLPITIGNLDVGTAVTTQVYLNVPSTATRISITESGPVQDVLGTNYNYSTAEAVIP